MERIKFERNLLPALSTCRQSFESDLAGVSRQANWPDADVLLAIAGLQIPTRELRFVADREFDDAIARRGVFRFGATTASLGIRRRRQAFGLPSAYSGHSICQWLWRSERGPPSPNAHVVRGFGGQPSQVLA
jgi:hypothetical protein